LKEKKKLNTKWLKNVPLMMTMMMMTMMMMTMMINQYKKLSYRLETERQQRISL